MERVWIYQSSKELSEKEVQFVLKEMNAFIDQWKAHGKPLAAAMDVKHNRFLVIRIDEAFAKATGCSIDRSVHELKRIQDAIETDFFDRMQIAYRDGATVKVVSRSAFENLIAEGVVHADTIVFNNMVDNYPDFATQWEVPLKNSWHAKVFRI